MYFIYLLDKPSHDLTFSKLIQQESMNGKPSFNCELQIRRHPSHDLAFSRPCQQDIMNREPSCNYELSQNDQPSDTKINSETNVTSNLFVLYFIFYKLI